MLLKHVRSRVRQPLRSVCVERVVGGVPWLPGHRPGGRRSGIAPSPGRSRVREGRRARCRGQSSCRSRQLVRWRYVSAVRCCRTRRRGSLDPRSRACIFRCSRDKFPLSKSHLGWLQLCAMSSREDEPSRHYQMSPSNQLGEPISHYGNANRKRRKPKQRRF